jgi:hypothetical protein
MNCLRRAWTCFWYSERARTNGTAASDDNRPVQGSRDWITAQFNVELIEYVRYAIVADEQVPGGPVGGGTVRGSAPHTMQHERKRRNDWPDSLAFHWLVARCGASVRSHVSTQAAMAMKFDERDASPHQLSTLLSFVATRSEYRRSLCVRCVRLNVRFSLSLFRTHRRELSQHNTPTEQLELDPQEYYFRGEPAPQINKQDGYVFVFLDFFHISLALLYSRQSSHTTDPVIHACTRPCRVAARMPRFRELWSC